MSNPLTAQIAADPKVEHARVFVTLAATRNDNDWMVRDALDSYRDAVIAATQRVMRESAQPVAWLCWMRTVNGSTRCDVLTGRTPRIGSCHHTDHLDYEITSSEPLFLHPSVVQESPAQKPYVFYVSAQRFESNEAVLTGGQIKKIANICNLYPLYQDTFGCGFMDDKPIGDGVAVNIAESVKHFYGLIPATRR